MSYGQVNADVIGTSVAGSNLGAGNASIMKNRIINGAMVIDQRNAGASITPTGDAYTVDRWRFQTSQSSKLSFQQNAGSVTPPAGFTNYLGATSLSAYSISSSDIFVIGQSIEGYNIADLGWGTANAKTITASFWVRSSLTGTFGGSVFNSAGDRSYPFTYTISAANTWEQKSITIAGDTTGTWLTTNGKGMQFNFGLGNGSTVSGTAGAWAAGNYWSATGATSVVGTNGATFYITGVQLEVGSSATGFEYVNYQTSLANCQRYFQSFGRSYQNGQRVMCGNNNTGVAISSWQFLTPMRTSPSVTLYGGNSTTGNIGFNYAGSQQTVAANVVLSNSGGFSSLSPNGWMVNFATSMTGSIPSWIDVGTQASGIGMEFSAEL